MKKAKAALVVTGSCVMAITAGANTITFDTPTGASVGGNAVDAEAVLTTGAGTLTITLRNLEANPNTVGQCLSAFGFTLSGGQTVASFIPGTVDSATARIIASNGSYADSGLTSASTIGWTLTGSSSGLLLDVLSGAGHSGPAHTLIGGPGNGNIYVTGGSIDGNGPHNPFLAGDLVLQLSIPGVTADSTVTGAFFQFGTTDGTGRLSVPDGGATVALLGLALSGLGLVRRKLG